ncbi:MAG: cell envelope integrity protein CreD, partial [Gammaproteobacteria bacterium]|nr:cell envelope integrity protein CreD [Gammaproteobacteria bacterium]
IAALMLLLLIPLAMIEGVVSERVFFREEARNSISQSWTGNQKLIGPVLIVPYVEYYKKREWDSNLKTYQNITYHTNRKLYILPENLQINGEVKTENRKRGLYDIPVYATDLDIKGTFSNREAVHQAQNKGSNIKWKKPYLTILISDIRGISEQPLLNWAGKEYEFASGSAVEQIGNGMHASLGELETGRITAYPFSFKVNLKGMEKIQFAAVGKTTKVSLSANWPHPSFIGRYLPATKVIDPDKFSATWQLSSFSSDMPRLINACQNNQCSEFTNNTFGVALINTVDIYHKTERSVKYAILFISLTFITFFLFEIMKNLRLHPMQYLLVGMSLTFFYLLLVSLSEHIAFIYAYMIAAGANIITIGIYISAILSSRKMATGFSGMLTLLYMMLYAILVSEDNSLLMGSLLFFSILSLVMLITRKVDWYEVTEKLANQTAHKSPIEQTNG